MHAYAKEAEGTRTVCLSEGPENSYMGSEQLPGQRQLPQDRQGTVTCGVGWCDAVQRAGELAKAPTAHHLSSRNTSASAAREWEQQEEGGL